ncbi:hypothetical protein Q2T46_11575 [Thermoanaerobacterium sp. CMT5567-10]|jgi:hypothetical protein|uniref:hypothetical protein n=1 Tax=Thermoanaerobacterium sp. CMT5567-10 TaxID=3061989 RepID=UPI0026DFBE94|nr:hypothetical protein [Thermoanaerobacterium sp. CMT5567-10]WKV08166.1 hypothetical protein Q2T46_11575 [Thermoanaerobacterium sp. CMT5567-10]
MNMSWGHEAKKLTKREKAEIILKNLEEYIQVDWNFKEFYLKAIEKGLTRIEMEEK